MNRFSLAKIALVLLLALASGSTWRAAASPLPPTTGLASDPSAVLSGEKIEQSSILAVDFDGDGDKELVVGGVDGMLYVVAYDNGSWSEAWSRQTADDLTAAGAPTGSPCVSDKSDIRSAPAVADLDNDGDLEIVVSTGGDTGNHRNGGILVYSYTSQWSFSLEPSWPQPRIDQVGGGAGAGGSDGCWDGFWSSPALGDLDGDGDLEVVVEGFDRRIHAWHHDGTTVSGWPIYRYATPPDNLLRGGWSSPALGDIDGDGDVEVFVGTDSPPWGGEGSPSPDYSKATVWGIDGDSNSLPGWPVTTQNNVGSSPALGDIDGDGELEVVVGSGDSVEGGDGHRVYAWNADGSAVSGWPQSTAGDMAASPALGDLDGDGDLEVVIGCGHEGDPYNPATCSKMYAWHGDGSSVSGFPLDVSANDGWTGANGLPYGPTLADYDGDGHTDILAVVRWSWGISRIHYNGNTWENDNDGTLESRNSLASSPLVDDIDNDGNLEVAIGGATQSGANGAVYVWDVSGSAVAERPWPMFQHNPARTGRYPLPPALGFSNEIVVFHQYGSSDTATRNVSVWNEGGGEFDWEITHSITRLQVMTSTGTVETAAQTQFVISTTGLLTGWHDLGSVIATGTFEGGDVEGSPRNSSLRLYVGDVQSVYLPLVLKAY